MRTIPARNVHQALVEGAFQLKEYGVRRESRNGPVVVLPIPLTTIYFKPEERVLFHPERDANPFFHLLEALWMLAGRDDLAWVAFYNSGMKNYSDDGLTLNAAYGHRWRKAFGQDQLQKIIDALHNNPDCRRQVLQMWGPDDLGSQSKDVPCNTQAYFQIDADGKLQMMVTNRSNDLIWGAYGANAVHFSMLHEYMALSMGREMGLYYQTSFNTHYYVEPHQELVDTLAAKAPMPPAAHSDPYSDGLVSAAVPLMSLPQGRWDRELATFMERKGEGSYEDPFLEQVAKPMARAYACFKSKDMLRFQNAYQEMGACIAPDWHAAGMQWLQRREAKCKAKS